MTGLVTSTVHFFGYRHIILHSICTLKWQVLSRILSWSLGWAPRKLSLILENNTNLPNCFLAYLPMFSVVSCTPSHKTKKVNQVTDSRRRSQSKMSSILYFVDKDAILETKRAFSLRSVLRSTLESAPLLSIWRLLNNMEVEEKEKEEGEGEKPLISLFASFQDYLSNDQEIREVRFARFSPLVRPWAYFPNKLQKRTFYSRAVHVRLPFGIFLFLPRGAK